MKVKKLCVWLLFFITYTFSGQIKGVVLDESNKPIPYVNIWIEGEEVGTTSEADGSFEISVSEKNLVFSAIGYETISIEASKCEKVYLKGLVYQLSEVIVTKPKKTKEITIGSLNKKNNSTHLASGNKPIIRAKYFDISDNIKNHSFLKEIIFETFSFKNDVRIILHFYDVNDDGSPGEELIDKNYFVFVKKGSKTNKVNIEKMNLSFSDKGIFVGLEWLIIRENEYINKNNTVYMMPLITVNKSEKEIHWVKTGNKWLKQDKFKNRETGQDTYLDLAINLTLTN